jgi:hypothetical protein
MPNLKDDPDYKKIRPIIRIALAIIVRRQNPQWSKDLCMDEALEWLNIYERES